MSFSPTITSPKKTGLVQPPNSPNPEYKQGKHFCYNHRHTIQSSLLIKCGNPQCRATDIQMKILENKFPGYLIYHDGYNTKNNTKNIKRYNVLTKHTNSAHSAKVDLKNKEKSETDSRENNSFEKELKDFEKFLYKDSHNEPVFDSNKETQNYLMEGKLTKTQKESYCSV